MSENTSRDSFDFIPHDTLFVRDQRPMLAGASFGHGANLPLPTHLHSALRTHLLSQISSPLPEAQKSGFKRNGKEKGSFSSEAFNWMNLQGPFPVHTDSKKGEEVYFPTPLDIQVKEEDNERSQVTYHPMKLKKRVGKSDLNSFLTHYVCASVKPTKIRIEPWMSSEQFQCYLKGDPLKQEKISSLYQTEYRMGIEINHESNTVVEGKLYGAEHLRLNRDWKMRFSISKPQSKHENRPDEDPQVIASMAGQSLRLGGESRTISVEEASSSLKIPSVEVSSLIVKWILLTPAIFMGGWRPGWIDDNGNVKLKNKNHKDFDRRAYRRDRREGGELFQNNKDQGESINGRLIAARVEKPIVMGGWELVSNKADGKPGPKATQLAVPAGSVYYFQMESAEEVQKLVKALNHRCRSDFYGEKGLGLGVCGNYEGEGL